MNCVEILEIYSFGGEKEQNNITVYCQTLSKIKTCWFYLFHVFFWHVIITTSFNIQSKIFVLPMGHMTTWSVTMMNPWNIPLCFLVSFSSLFWFAGLKLSTRSPEQFFLAKNVSSCCNFTFVWAVFCISLLSKCCAHALRRFRWENCMLSVRKTSWFGLKYLFWSPQSCVMLGCPPI